MGHLNDKNFDWARKRIYRSYMDLASWVTLGTNAYTGAAAADEVKATGLAGAAVAATTDVVPDAILLPYDLDQEQETRIRVYWDTEATPTTDTLKWVGKYGTLSNASAIAVGTTAFDTVIAQDTSAGADKLNISAWGIIIKNKLSPGKLTTFNFQPATTTINLAGEPTHFLGYEIEYAPRRTSREAGRKLVNAHLRDTITY